MSKQPTAAEIADQIRRNFADWALASGAPMVARFNRAIEALGSHAIEVLEAELPAQDARGAATMSDPQPMWQIRVTLPFDDVTDEQRNALFTAIADAAHGWEPTDRNGWDVDVQAGPTE